MPCRRCGGLMLAERFSGGDGVFTFWSYEGLRCVNCGAITVPAGPPLMETVGDVPVLRPGAEGAS